MNNIEKNLEIYYECLKKEYKDPSIEPLLGTLYGLVRGYEQGIREGKYINLFMDKNSIDNLRAKYISQLLPLFTRIVKTNKQGKVYEACRFLLAYTKDISRIYNWLTFVFFPQDAYLEDSYEYYLTINNLISQYETGNDMEKRIKSLDADFYEILRQYENYLKKIPCRNRDEIYIHISFVNYMQAVIAHFYKEKYDISLFPKVLDYVFNNLGYLDDFVEMNNNNEDKDIIDENITQMVINKIMDNCTKNNPIIR